MGSTYATIQILNREQLTPDRFREHVSGSLAPTLLPATEADADRAFRIVFSPGSDWVTLTSREYEIGGELVLSEAESLAKSLNTHCVVTTVYDSDFVWLQLLGPAESQRDTVAVGIPALVEEIMRGEPVPKGTPEQWAPLLRGPSTWEQLVKAWGDIEVFAEEGILNMAPLLGMDKEYIVADYSYWQEVEPDSGRAIALTLKSGA